MIAAKLSRIYKDFAGHVFLVLAALSTFTPASVSAQDIPAGSSAAPWSRFELYGGYAYLNPPDSSTSSYKNQPQLPGFSFSATDYFDHYVGIQGQVDFFPSSPNNSILRTEAGPLFRYPVRRFVPFVHALAGLVRASGPQSQSQSWGVALTAGAAVDYALPKFNTHVSIRLIQADFDYTHITYGYPEDVQVTGFLSQLSAGVVYRSGETAFRRPIQMGCTADKAEVFPGEPIAITAQLLGEDPKRPADFHWISTGGHLEGTGDAIRLDTQAVAPGDYVVTGTVHQGRKATAKAHCVLEFRVLQFQPPTASCSANPQSVVQGGKISIHTSVSSSQNRALTYEYSASTAVITGSGSDVVLDTSGAPPGDIQVACKVTDASSQTAKVNIAIRILPPPEKPKPTQINPLCSLTFDSEKQSATRIGLAAHKCLDQVADALAEQPTMNLILLAKHAEDEPPDFAALRALNAAEYLIHERNVDPNRLKLLSGSGYGREVDSYLLNKNETFLPGDAVTIDASSLVRHTPLYTKPPSTRKSTKPQP